MKVKFRDILAAAIVSGCFGVFIAHAAGALPSLAGEVKGALIAILQTVVFFYFRKKPSGEAIDRD